MSNYTHLSWHRVTEPCQPPAKPGGVCVSWQTGAMRAPAFYYYDTLAEALDTYPELAPQIAATAADLIDAGKRTQDEWARYLEAYVIPDLDRQEYRGEPICYDQVRNLLLDLIA